MLLKIREKTQGVFSWLIILVICVPFTLWGIQNYLDIGQEKPVATVGDQEFFQRDVNRAYQQFRDSLRGMKIDEETIKKQALDKLIKDEVLLQHVQEHGLVVNDQDTRKFIASLDYFKTDGKFDKKQYKALLASQRLSPQEFAARIQKALIMEQFQRSIADSGFATAYEVDAFFKIQNQQRSVELLKIPLADIGSQPTDAEIDAYYQENQDNYKTDEALAIEYIELSLTDLAAKVEPSEEELTAYYEEQAEQFTTKERRKISHILIANSDTAKTDADAVRARLDNEDFAVVAKAVSADKLSAEKGGDLGLIVKGDMQEVFETAAFSLQEGEVSQPVKTEFGYHIIKVTELTPGSIKPLAEVKDKVKSAYQTAQAENDFFELAELLAEVSYENADSLDVAVEAVGIPAKKSALFTRSGGSELTAEPNIIEAAFSADVLAGNNSEPVELGANRVVVLRVAEHQPAALRALVEVKTEIIETLLNDQANQQTLAKAEQFKKDVMDGAKLKALAEQAGLEYQSLDKLQRSSGELDWQTGRAIFSAAKPKGDQPTTVLVRQANGEQWVVNVVSVIEGELPEATNNQRQLAQTNIAKAHGQSDFNAALGALQENASIEINEAE